MNQATSIKVDKDDIVTMNLKHTLWKLGIVVLLDPYGEPLVYRESK